jgi:hypothetical protein|tara:strand:+ start:64 stop:399 length:336 start_codon:yes stop_codon:yes gene_type:complete
MKSIIFAGLLLGCAHGVQASPYVNVEANQGYLGGEYQSTGVDIHAGVEGKSWYLQGGPVVLASPDENNVELSGKAGGSVQLEENLSVYGELSFITGEQLGVGTKIGAKYSF